MRERTNFMTDTQKKVFATEMKRLREEANMSTAEFSKYLGVSQSYISNIECVNRTPSMPLMEKIAGAFDLTVDDMLKPHDERVVEERREFGKTFAKARAEKGFTASLVAGALGIPTAVYKDFESGNCTLPERTVETLKKLLGIGEEAPAPIEVKPEAEVEDPISVVICDIVLEHITDLKVDKDTQRKVWRYFSNIKMTAEEHRLFG